MVRELDDARVKPAPWRRMWTRMYEHAAVFFLTPQQWGLDSEIVLALPLQGLVVTGVGDDMPSTQSPHLVHGGDDSPDAGSGGATCENGEDLAQAAADSEYKTTCFMLLVSSSSQREHFPRLLVSAAAGLEPSRSFVYEPGSFPCLAAVREFGEADPVEKSREWAEAFVQRIQMSHFRANLQQAFRHTGALEAEQRDLLPATLLSQHTHLHIHTHIRTHVHAQTLLRRTKATSHLPSLLCIAPWPPHKSSPEPETRNPEPHTLHPKPETLGACATAPLFSLGACASAPPCCPTVTPKAGDRIPRSPALSPFPPSPRPLFPPCPSLSSPGASRRGRRSCRQQGICTRARPTPPGMGRQEPQSSPAAHERLALANPREGQKQGA